MEKYERGLQAKSGYSSQALLEIPISVSRRLNWSLRKFVLPEEQALASTKKINNEISSGYQKKRAPLTLIDPRSSIIYTTRALPLAKWWNKSGSDVEQE